MTVALVVCIKRRRELTREEFSRYWREVHAPIIQNCGGFNQHLVSYTQHHLSGEGDEIADMFGVSGDYDGIAVLEFASRKDLIIAFKDPDYVSRVRPDEPNFVDLERGLCFVTRPAKII